MKKYFWGVTCALFLLLITIVSWKAESIGEPNKTQVVNISKPSTKELFAQYLSEIYNTAQLQASGLDFTVFQKAATGYFNLKASKQVPQYSSVLTIVDLAKSSRTKRMWIVDLVEKQLLLNTWVAHGNGSGGDMADRFSNKNDSHASSLGFYITAGTYLGKHGRSLKLNGLDEGFNDKALARGIVVHAAPYVSQGAINGLGRLGRSEGCPAVSPKVANKVIETIKGNSVLFINGNDDNYNSKYLNEEAAASYVYPEGTTLLNSSL